MGGLPTHPQPNNNGNASNGDAAANTHLNGLTPIPPSTTEAGAAGETGTSPVSSAVRSLNSLTDFGSMDPMGGGSNGQQSHPGQGGGSVHQPFDSYSVTDSLLSSDGSGSVRAGSKEKDEGGHHHHQHQQGGPLLDFKTAFTDVENKPPGGDLR